MKRLLFLDTETTGLTPNDRLCQLAYKVDDIVVNEIFNPGVEIGVGAMAVHHITNAQVKDKHKFQDSDHYIYLKEHLENDDTIFVAHNASFDIGMIEREGLKVKNWICTLKLARYLLKNDPSIDKYSLQHLRYHFNIDKEAIAHDAWGDIVVLEEVFDNLFTIALRQAAERGKEKGVTYTQADVLKRMLDLSMNKFTLLKIMPFGKHQGKSIVDLIKSEPQYISWIVNKMEVNDGNREVVESVKYYLKQYAK